MKLGILLAATLLLSACDNSHAVVGPEGPPGRDGTNGTNGTNGRDGAPGKDGAPGTVAHYFYQSAGADGTAKTLLPAAAGDRDHLPAVLCFTLDGTGQRHVWDAIPCRLLWDQNVGRWEVSVRSVRKGDQVLFLALW